MTATVAPLAADALLERAAAATGLAGAPRPSFRTALALLVEDWNRPLAASGSPAETLRAELERVTEQHLRLQAAPPAHLTAETPVVAITGLPRTGTTLLHTLLAARERATFVPFHRALRPFGPAERSRELAAVDLAVMRAVSPQVLDLHPMAVDLPDECLTLLQVTGWSERFLFYGPAPTYTDALLAHDMDEPYGQLGQLLAGAARPGRTLVIKNPGHLARLSSLATVAPRLTVVWLHRDPVDAFASFCGLVASVRRLFTGDDVDLRSLGPEWLRVWRHHCQRAASARAGLDVIDVTYDELVADPAGTTAWIVDRLGGDAPLGAGTVALPGCEIMRPSGHRWPLSRFGVGEDEVRAALDLSV